VTTNIHKLEIPIKHRFRLSFPKGAKILSVQSQRNVPVLWFSFVAISVRSDLRIVDPVPVYEEREFLIATTGSSFEEENTEYIGTFQIQGGEFIGHLYEQKGAS
jgi:hypothetical protein